jgi:hypothetical protein
MDALVARVEQQADAAVARALNAVIAGMHDRRIDQPGTVDRLTRSLSATVPSSLGFTITLQTGLRAVRLTTAAPVAVDSANARLLLLLSPTTEPGSSAVFYAADAGAFDSLASSDSWRACSYGVVVLDSYPHWV